VVAIHIGPVSCTVYLAPLRRPVAGAESNQCFVSKLKTTQCGVWTGSAVERMETKAKWHESRDDSEPCYDTSMMFVMCRCVQTQQRQVGPKGVVVGALTSKNGHSTDATMQGEDMPFRHELRLEQQRLHVVSSVAVLRRAWDAAKKRNPTKR
jgi:hypothetical protein